MILSFDLKFTASVTDSLSDGRNHVHFLFELKVTEIWWFADGADGSADALEYISGLLENSYSWRGGAEGDITFRWVCNVVGIVEIETLSSERSLIVNFFNFFHWTSTYKRMHITARLRKSKQIEYLQQLVL